MQTDTFTPDPAGYVRHWVHTGPALTPYGGAETSETRARAEVVSEDPGQPPAFASVGGPGPDGRTWRFHYPGRNGYVDQGAFHHKLGHLSLHAATLLVSNREMEIPLRVWTANTVDLWQDQDHVLRFTRHRRKAVSASPTVVLHLKPGQNRLSLRLQELAVRDTPFLFALQMVTVPDGVRIAVPGVPTATAALARAARWLDDLDPAPDGVRAAGPPPAQTEVVLDRPDQSVSRAWLTGEDAVTWHEQDVFACRVETRPEGQRLRRSFEFPSRLPTGRPGESLDDYRAACLESIATNAAGEPARSLFAILARHALGSPDREGDEQALRDGLDHVSDRLDCADFRLAALLRLYALGWGHPEQRNTIRMAALGFRYWHDEPGTDAMAFGSENHALLFHGCQHIAGVLFPDDPFTNAGRTGKEQRDLGLTRCREWLNDRHAHGFTEYLSATYAPITAAALLNLVDFSDDAELRTSASTLLDRLLKQLCEHTFDGVTAGPQGRVYRSVLYPQTSASQGLLSWTLGGAVVAAADPWTVFFATTDRYEPPEDLVALTERRIRRQYHQASHCIQLHKTPHFVMSSVQVGEDTPLVPGKPGYQELLWHASLSKDCHVFANHPGTISDAGISRPGYWHGNGILPAVAQHDATVFVAYDIPADHPIPFTHAHWPADAFYASVSDDEGWHLGRVGDGYVGLWCSLPTERVTDVIPGRDLVARGRRVAWICSCADTETVKDMDDFRTRCLSAHPRFDADRGGLFWDDRQIL